MRPKKLPSHIVDIQFSAPAAFTEKLPADSTRVFSLLGENLEDGPTFGDNEWDLSDLNGWPPGPAHLRFFRFVDIPELWRPLAKLSVLISLNPVHIAMECGLDPVGVSTYFPKAASPMTAQGTLKKIHVSLLAVLHSGGQPFRGLKESEWFKVQTLLRHGATASQTGVIREANKPVSPFTAYLFASSLVTMERTALLFGWSEPFGSPVFNNEPISKIFKNTKRYFNATRPNDEAEVAVAVAAFFFRSGIAENIVDAAAFWFAKRAEQPSEDGKYSAAQKEKFAGFVAGFINEHGAFPRNQRDGNIDWRRLFLLADFAPSKFSPFDTALREKLAPNLEPPVQENFLDWVTQHPRKDLNFCPVQPVEVESFVTGEMVQWCEPADLEMSERFLSMVGWVTWMAVTLLHGECNQRLGDRELLDRDNCVEEFLDVDGQPHWRLKGWRKKNKLTSLEEIEFPISKTLFDAMKLVQRLHVVLGVDAQPIRRLKGTGVVGHHLLAGGLIPKAQKSRDGELLNSRRQFVREDVNALIALLEERNILEHEPLGGISPREFRITALQNYAGATPHGQSVASKMGAWGSAKVERGYIGDVRTPSHAALSASNSFNDSTEDVAVQRGAVIVELAQRVDLNEAGMSRMAEARHLHPEIDEIVHNKALMTDKQLRKALERIGERDQRFHVGLFGACSYNPSRALCDGDGWLNPQECRPTACHNSIQTRAHRASSELERRLIEKLVDENPRSILADSLKVMNEDRPEVFNEDGEVFYEFDELDDAELRVIALEAEDIGQSVPVEITRKEES